jgi:uncharacterized protein (TIGR02231 family)
MRAKIFISLVSAALTVTAAQAQNQAQPAVSKSVSSKVTAATVFLQGAELTASAQLALRQGANEVTIDGLSPFADRNSIRVTIDGGVVVSAFEYSIDYLSAQKAPSARLRMLRDSIDIYSSRLAATEVDIKVNGEMQKYLETGIAKNVSGSEAGLGLEELKKTMDYYKSKSEEILNGARELQNRRNTISTALDRVLSQYDEESGSGSGNSGVVKLNLSAPVAGTRTATIVYFTPAASWSPYYDINAASTDTPVTIAAKSRVRQTTGIDWENVTLTLSTSTPSSGKVAPLFETWFLRERPMPMTPMLVGRAPGITAAQNAYSYNMARPEDVDSDGMEGVVVVASGASQKSIMTGSVVPAIYDHVVTAEGALNVTYNIDLPYTIPSGGKEQTIDLTTKQATPEYKYYCAPKLDGATYLIAEIANWEELGLLSAPANVTYDGTYIGETTIDAASTREKLTLTLGTDKRVSVTRELAREVSATRAIGGNTEQTFTWRITVRNSQTGPVSMVLKDQYPTSTDKSVTVTLDTKTTTPWTANKEDLGVVTWEGTLAAGEVRVYTFSYTVKYPRGMRLDL